jgi:hypothetical protein
MKKQFTKEEKSVYFAGLRSRWNDAKSMSEEEKQQAAAIMLVHGFNVSAVGYYFVAAQMKAQGLEGIPYIDARTFQGWKECGFQVRRGEHSTLSGITWIKALTETESTEPEGEGKGFVFPKEYHLFHLSQVEPIQ